MVDVSVPIDPWDAFGRNFDGGVSAVVRVAVLGFADAMAAARMLLQRRSFLFRIFCSSRQLVPVLGHQNQNAS